MTLDQRSQEIIAQVAVKSAIELIGYSAFHEMPEGTFAGLLGETSQVIFDRILELAAPSSAALIQNQFPGATVEPSNVVPITTQWTQTSGPAPVPGVSGGGQDDDEKWRRYFQNPSAYYDNRGNKTNPRSPDFKEKQGAKEALWIQSKGTPQWVYARFGQANSAPEAF